MIAPSSSWLVLDGGAVRRVRRDTDQAIDFRPCEVCGTPLGEVGDRRQARFCSPACSGRYRTLSTMEGRDERTRARYARRNARERTKRRAARMARA